MLINMGLRTDIVRFYSEWLFNRFREGFVYSRNPLFPTKVTYYDLTPEKVDAVLFCSKDYSPALPRLGEITGRFRTLFHYTVNGYGGDVEPTTPPLSERIETFRALSKAVGREKLFWRYDPILLTPTYTPEWHAETFTSLAEKLAPYTAGCIVNFVDGFIRLYLRMPELVRLTDASRRWIGKKIASAAEKYRLPLRSCAMGSDCGIPRHGCVTLADIAAANGCKFRDIRHLGNQKGCACIESRDIGWYDSCPGGCRYCNANRTGDPAENVARHDPASPILIGYPDPLDTVIRSKQESFLSPDDGQISLFDL